MNRRIHNLSGVQVRGQPVGKHLCESFHRAGGVPAIMGELAIAGLLDESPLTVRNYSTRVNP